MTRSRAALASFALGAAFVLASTLAPPAARADAIVMPASCPAGSRDAFCHGPPTCEPRGCVSSLDCDAGEVCAARSLCIETHSCFGVPSTSLVDHVLGACDPSGACAAGTCGAYFVCAPGPALLDAAHADAGTGPEHATYCGCRVGRRSPSEAVVCSLVSCLGLLAMRRTMRRRR